MSDIGNEVFKAIGWKKLPFGGKDLHISLDANACHEVARLLAPLIAEAQAGALTAFADAHRMPEPLFMDDGRAVTVGDLLRERAAQIRKGKQ